MVFDNFFQFLLRNFWVFIFLSLVFTFKVFRMKKFPCIQGVACFSQYFNSYLTKCLSFQGSETRNFFGKVEICLYSESFGYQEKCFLIIFVAVYSKKICCTRKGISYSLSSVSVPTCRDCSFLKVSS